VLKLARGNPKKTGMEEGQPIVLIATMITEVIAVVDLEMMVTMKIIPDPTTAIIQIVHDFLGLRPNLTSTMVPGYILRLVINNHMKLSPQLQVVVALANH
jgi:hypothetical protein